MYQLSREVKNMSKCSFETECKGNGTCCAFCEHGQKCDSKCQMVYMTYSSKDKRQQQVRKCDWFHFDE
jgi:hypothetical protein